MGSLRGEVVTMAQFIDTIISAFVISLVMLVAVIASAIYEKWQERKSK